MEGIVKSNCVFCDKAFSTTSNLKRHIKKNHGIRLGSNLNHKCVECRNAFSTFVALRQHYVVQHKFEEKKESLRFRSREEFQLWKKKEEKQTRTQYVAHTGGKRLSNGTTKWYYACHRGGVFKSKGKGKRRLKSQGSVKIGHCCLASMDVVEDDSGVISCNYFSNHYGHSFDDANSFLTFDDSSKQQRMSKNSQNAVLQEAESLVDDINTTEMDEEQLCTIHESLTEFLKVVKAKE